MSDFEEELKRIARMKGGLAPGEKRTEPSITRYSSSLAYDEETKIEGARRSAINEHVLWLLKRLQLYERMTQIEEAWPALHGLSRAIYIEPVIWRDKTGGLHRTHYWDTYGSANLHMSNASIDRDAKYLVVRTSSKELGRVTLTVATQSQIDEWTNVGDNMDHTFLHEVLPSEAEHWDSCNRLREANSWVMDALAEGVRRLREADANPANRSVTKYSEHDIHNSRW